ncbi:hypothetical protein K458DRAFT_426076 [Lentithecium fluviatile CBS 122367]|uniref:NACHT domain-containing protein n=1 Tax=Lentithecium fluviatile CBS 122367 TaxID=1168545 RepID=A0A6G1JK40_9PLEO|nr:hypothetical protein K458DRAFT_426076 [Lentithecium fluviatile CBS 122367]
MLGKPDLIRSLVGQHDTSIDCLNSAGETPLYKACAAGQYESVMALMDLGASPLIRVVPLDVSCLHWAFLFPTDKMENVVSRLLSTGIAVDARVALTTRSGAQLEADWIERNHFPFHWPAGTPLHWAAHATSTTAVDALLKHGAHVDELDLVEDDRAQTALAMALCRGSVSMVSHLIERGADTARIDNRGCSSMHIIVSDCGFRLGMHQIYDRNVSDRLRICQRFKDIYSDWPPFRESLTEVYYHVVGLLFKIHAILRSNEFRFFAKAFVIPYNKEFQDCVLAIVRHTTLLEGEATFAHHRIVYLERRSQLMERLSPVDSAQDLLRAQSKMTPGTGEWVQTNTSYLTWRHWRGSDSVLWLSGPPGSGKTILAASVVKDLQRQSIALRNSRVAFFFFHSSDRKKANHVEAAASIYSQLVADCQHLPAKLIAAFESAARYGRCRISCSDKPMDILNDLLQKDAQKTYLVLDRIDESTDATDMVQQFLALGNSHNVRILLASRETPDMTCRLSQHLWLKLTPSSTTADINIYLRTGLSIIADSFGKDDLSNILFDKLSAAAAGSFLWVFLMLQTLQKASNTRDLLSMTTKLPRDLGEVYESALQSLNQGPTSMRNLGRDLLCCVCFSRRPLRWKELEHALSFDSRCEEEYGKRKPFKSAVLQLCNPLIEYHPTTDEFRPVHWSVCEFLTQREDVGFFSHHGLSQSNIAQNAHSLLVRVCVQDLKHAVAAETLHITADKTPLGEYATLNWCYHLLHESDSQVLRHDVEDFILVPSLRKNWIARYMLLERTTFPLQVILKQLYEVQAWIAKAQNEAGVARFDVLRDMLEIIHLLSLPWPQSQIPSASICTPGYFDKMMVVRDLARSYMLDSRLPDAVRWLTDALRDIEERCGDADTQSVWILNSLGIMYDQQNLFSVATDT